MKQQAEDILKDIQNIILKELKEAYNYRGENALFEMIYFCKRANLKTQANILILLLGENRIK